jgi:hypothetical protein
MKSNLDQMKQPDSLDPGLEVFLLCFDSLAAEQGLTKPKISPFFYFSKTMHSGIWTDEWFSVKYFFLKK